ncbi:ribonuclease T2 family protein (macronuclear) [Tetrahymena thermophila SB210]|uniref:Ribonuclease T2 family protein n=1 Tax=Tetrahymena thermophila (strain SB210) TaxID=312017 RepID=Q23HC8_TETTS|nr:ribonuclease T2 family protein [Tetrahymena thermophila SB210]EAR95880.1 ribonuclease T2 family protein [Tetrahymena thermophila SB210]|eukprot:XP_001016125.1 ribonuclease T2 family protein [Tetrahymena thermophila SB210]
MNQNKILALLCISFCIFQISQATQKDAYVLSYLWPVYENYSGDKEFTKQDFPFFDGSNFAINYFYPLPDQSYVCSPPICNNHHTFNATNIKEKDYIYLEKYFLRFGQNNSQTSQDLWKNYGSCYNHSQTQYFHAMSQAHQKLNVVEALKAENIVPSEEIIYERSQIQKALSKKLNGLMPDLFCSKFTIDQEKGESYSYLRRFEIYFDKDLNPTQSTYLCTYEYCPDKIKIPPFKF